MLFSSCLLGWFADSNVQFSIANMLVNLTNSFDRPDESEEREQLKKLGKYAGEHIPEPHPKDAEDFVQKRGTDNKYTSSLFPI